MISNSLLEIICCPETKQDLALVESDAIVRLNAKIADGSVTNRGGQPVTEPLDSGLVRGDREYVYPIRDDIPVLLIDEAIAFGPFDGRSQSS